ncbi:hypothetical protein OFO12_05540 [Campylobacter sp. JMF_04 NA10]|uniref:hypothetical protein n=1 Tax=Campylobacter sp. JMF_04 NA10 TaxID=2983824 RepID=UPI0022E9DB65|nr:hypothetical protein [Campylobacter sp. JMF_04 NA10]MDA3076832.1 hypothetical protein [Campylobacter sp. JMF_04 NA10]
MVDLNIEKNFLPWIYYWIKEISDIKQQKMHWLNENNIDNGVSSYIEIMCSLFDDLKFDDFVENTAPALGFSVKLISLLRDFRDGLKNYIAEDDNDDEAIIKDPNWQIVVKKAQNVIVAWDEYKEGNKND